MRRQARRSFAAVLIALVLAAVMGEVGFRDVRVRPLDFGVVTVHTGVRT